MVDLVSLACGLLLSVPAPASKPLDFSGTWDCYTNGVWTWVVTIDGNRLEWRHAFDGSLPVWKGQRIFIEDCHCWEDNMRGNDGVWTIFWELTPGPWPELLTSRFGDNDHILVRRHPVTLRSP